MTIKIGLTYLKGSVPGFEDFGNIPTDIVKSNGLINGIEAHKELDAIIIPGGSIVESESLSSDLAIEIKKIAKEGKPVIGICSGFQAISNQTNTGRKSPCPIIKEGMGLLDAKFSPFISNDRVKAYTTNDSFFTNDISNIYGFHSHTYGKIEYNNAVPLMYSKIKRANYSDLDNSVLSGLRNDEGNVIGTMIHGILDENPKIIDNIFDFMGIDEKSKIDIFNRNEKVKIAIRKELAIDSGIKNPRYNLKKKDNYNFNKNRDNNIYNNNKSDNNTSDNKNNTNQMPPVLMIGSTGSDSGKTFITTGIAGVLTKKGMNVAILKVGPDVRDTVPSLYLTKGKMEDYTSIKIGHLGWMDIKNVLLKLKNSNYDFVLIEGVMSVFTGVLNEKIPYSGVEIAASSDIPILLVSGVNKGGIESAAIDITYHCEKLKEMEIDINGIILNKIYDNDIFKDVHGFIKEKTDVSEVIAIPKIKLDERTTTPEVEIKLEDFSLAALDTIEKYLDIDKIIQMAAIPKFNRYLSLKEIKNYF